MASIEFPKPDMVTFERFARFAAVWMDADCAAPEWCGGGDLNASGAVNGADLLIFASHGLGEAPAEWLLK